MTVPTVNTRAYLSRASVMKKFFIAKTKKLDSDTQTYNTSITYPTQHNVGFNHKRHSVQCYAEHYIFFVVICASMSEIAIREKMK
jgi:hypothetical protein